MNNNDFIFFFKETQFEEHLQQKIGRFHIKQLNFVNSEWIRNFFLSKDRILVFKKYRKCLCQPAQKF
ncbi:hypothetical protein KFK09_016514 [Dendrobium nobile]|uniref:Uncharacterized protein n=1 Tax=Dendrobium nobile TaxID=94219 RepID=A0A8T3AYW7_DENNO|nr:hypothetical protein KFK09_016514 [Dendrobium nobile]